ncbi:MAG: hypothetical protein CVV22_11235 [Ignavibacteriae bacterium HGW-Ignavibacteriae-1]|jgi:UDP-N-acetylglucosamine diphosphorylase/glucosamine-1-phosphate N-acetyltransferase|nr:MAG: hypothetical protein CVV22_11235 [Ignavibacteriae bacterium HGW-Ignavibacteriae-1]
MDINNIILFENNNTVDLYPFSIMHCSWELRTGVFRNYDRVQHLFPKVNIGFIGRALHIASFTAREGLENNFTDGNALLIDGSAYINYDFPELLESKLDSIGDKPIILTSNGKRFGCFIPENYDFKSSLNSQNINLDDDIFKVFDEIEFPGIIQYNYLWDTLDTVGENIAKDAKIVTKNYHRLYLPQFHGIHAHNPDNVLVGKNISISPNVLLDATEGPIILGDGVRIMPNSTIIGPTSIGDNTVIKIGAKIYGNNIFGPHCKVGGEIENSIIQSYSNKQHDGYLGHSYICEWVNLGADTNTSDLKNTYSEIRMELPHKSIDTGKIFVGLMCGDHTKSGINSMFTTGTTAGICGILVKEWFLPNYIKSYSWGGKSTSPVYKFDSAIETAKIVMARRNKTITDEEIALMQIEYDKVRESQI